MIDTLLEGSGTNVQGSGTNRRSQEREAQRTGGKNLAVWARIAFSGIALASVSLLPGCGGSKTPAPAPAPTTTAGSANTPNSSDNAATAPAGEAAGADATTNQNAADTKGRKWISDIPYDVFFDDPLSVAANNTPTTVAAPSMAGGNMAGGNTAATGSPAPSTPAPATSAGTGGASDWKSLITMEQVATEAKRLRNHLTASLQSQGTYNGNYAELQVDGAVVAALAMVVAEHPEDASWKPNARYLREFGSQLREASKSLGRESFTASQTAAENIEAVLNGNLPANAGDPPATKPYSEAANRAGVMKRIEKASDWMRANINSQSVFDKELEQIRQEAAVLAALAKMIGDKSYDSADEDDYAKYAKDLLDGAQQAGTSAQDKDYAKFQESINKIQKACGECHLNYGNG